MSTTPPKLEAFRIVKWHQRHSNAEQRRCGGSWVIMPTSFDSLGLQRLLRTKGGVEAFGVYCLLAELAGRVPTPGVLAGQDGPYSIGDLAIITGGPERAMQTAIDALQSPLIGWIDRVPWPHQWPNSEGCRPPEQQHDAASLPPVAIAVTGDPQIFSGNSGFTPGHARTTPGRRPDDARSVPSRAPAGAHAAAAAAAASSSSKIEECSSSSSSDAPVAVADPVDADAETNPGANPGGNPGVFDILRRCGVSVKAAHQIAADPTVTPGMVLAHWADVAKDTTVRSPGVIIGMRLATPANQRKAVRLSTYAVREAVNLGVVKALDGQTLTAADVRASDSGVSVRGQALPSIWNAKWG